MTRHGPVALDSDSSVISSGVSRLSWGNVRPDACGSIEQISGEPEHEVPDKAPGTRDMRLRPKCDRLGGTYVEGGFWKGNWIEFSYRDHTVYLQMGRDQESIALATWFSVELPITAESRFVLLREWPGQSMLRIAVAFSSLSSLECDGLPPRTVAFSQVPSFGEWILRHPVVVGTGDLHTPLMVMMGPRSALLHGTFAREVNVIVQGIETRVETLRSLLTLTERLIDLLAESDAAGPARL